MAAFGHSKVWATLILGWLPAPPRGFAHVVRPSACGSPESNGCSGSATAPQFSFASRGAGQSDHPGEVVIVFLSAAPVSSIVWRHAELLAQGQPNASC